MDKMVAFHSGCNYQERQAIAVGYDHITYYWPLIRAYKKVFSWFGNGLEFLRRVDQVQRTSALQHDSRPNNWVGNLMLT